MSKKKDKPKRVTKRDMIAPMIAGCIKQLKDAGVVTETAIRKALCKQREDSMILDEYSVSIWRDEVNIQLGVKGVRRYERKLRRDEARGQKHLFNLREVES